MPLVIRLKKMGLFPAYELTGKKLSIVKAYFPNRTRDMRHTLENIHSFVFYKNLFLIAGSFHLEEDQNREREDGDPFSLKELYNFLALHKDIVVLRPKNLQPLVY